MANELNHRTLLLSYPLPRGIGRRAGLELKRMVRSMMLSLPRWLELEPGEIVVFHERPDRRARLGALLASLGLFEVWRGRTHFVVTDRRLATVRGVLSVDRQEIPLARIEQVSIRRRGRSVTVVVSTVGGALGTQSFGPLGERQAERLVNAMEHRFGEGVPVRPD